MATITTTTPPENLTGWTVTVPTGWTCNAFYFQSYFIDGVFLSYPNDGLTSFRFGFNIENGQPAANTIFANGSFGSKLLTPSDTFSFSVSGGSDVTNSYFIQWLADNNAIFSKEEEGTQVDKTNNLPAFLKDLYQGIVKKKPDASKNPQNFRSEIEAIVTGITPTGSLTITENGTYPVTEKAEVIVAVPETPEWDGSFTKSVNNLTGTTWEIPSGWQTAAGQGYFTIDGELTINNTTISILQIHLGVSSSGAAANYIAVGNADGLQYFDNTNGFTLKINGGTDVTDTYIARWLGSGGKDTDWTIIRFFIEDENGDLSRYKALGGMTWAEWVESDFNTDGFKVSGTNIVSASGLIVVTESYVTVNSGEEIVANATYVVSASGGV